MITVTSQSDAQTEELAAQLAERLEAGDVLALDGALGAGKTSFVRGLARGLGIDPARVSSPTYIICHVYERADGAQLIHIDAYRIGSDDELESVGWQEMLDERRGIIVVEWADRIADALPENIIRIHFEHLSENERRITIEINSDSGNRLCGWKPDPDSADEAPCRTCGTMIAPDSPYWPFCSTRCQNLDLHRWFSGQYTMSRPLNEDDLL